MKKVLEPVYLPMPVSFEVKREWNRKGYQVVDAAFMPEGYENPADTQAPSKQKPRKPPVDGGNE